jgi:hypothetical protein
MPVAPPSGLGLGSGSDSGSGSAALTSGFTVPPSTDSVPPPHADLAAAPSTSSHHSQHAARQLEHSRRQVHSPDRWRTPTPHPLPAGNAMQPPTSNGQYTHLPAHLAAQLAALPPLPPPPRHYQCSHAPPAAPLSISF